MTQPMKRAFPKRLTWVAAAMTLLVMLGLGVQHWKSLGYLADLKDRHIPASELSATIVHLNDLLTDSATLAVLTGFDRWEQRYERTAPLIDMTSRKFTNLVSGVVSAKTLAQLHNTRKALFTFERQALGLGHERLESAFKILNGKNYQGLRAAYSKAVYDIVGKFSSGRNAAIERHHRVARVTVAASVVSLLFLLVAWTYVLRVIRDYESHRKSMYAQLSQASRLTSLGTLSSGVAHELRNPLTVVKGLAQQMELEVGLSSESKEMAKQIVEEASRIEDITDHLRSFAREGSGDESRPFDMNQSVERSLKLLTQQLKNRNIELTLDLDSSLPQVSGNASGFESVIQNLVANSRDAFELRDMKDREITVRTTVSGEGSITIAIGDNAGGIPEEILPRLFDPFFTTKGEKGTGLGLSIVHGIVTQHGGRIDVDNTPGKGVTFNIVLPTSGSLSQQNRLQAA